MFWDEAAKQTNLHGTRIGNRDRMCAIALVKRFAWAAYFRDRAVATTDRDADFEIGRRYPDIDTICAAEWVNRAELDRATTHAEGEPYRPY